MAVHLKKFAGVIIRMMQYSDELNNFGSENLKRLTFTSLYVLRI